eukprot:5322194-Alexandrium_andersonii.AAC.1
MSPFRAQCLLLRASAHHALDHLPEDDPHRAGDRPPADRQALSAEGDRAVHQRRGLRTYRL